MKPRRRDFLVHLRFIPVTSLYDPLCAYLRSYPWPVPSGGLSGVKLLGASSYRHPGVHFSGVSGWAAEQMHVSALLLRVSIC